MNPRKLLFFGLALIASGWVGYLFGQQKLKIALRNWQPAVVINKSPANSGEQADFSLFWKVWDRVSQLYVDKQALDSKKMVDGAIAGMVAAIGDPYTVYLPVKQNNETKEDLGGAFEGVGIQLGYNKDKLLLVVAPLSGSPAEKAGVKAGDIITHISDKANNIERDTNGMTTTEATNLIRGKKGTHVTLTLYRDGMDKQFDVDLARDTIVVKSVTVDFRGDKAVVKITRFGDRTQEEWNSAVSEILMHNPTIKGVVLDLRNNPGGYLEGAVYIAGEFLPKERVVVSQQYGDGTKTENKVDRNGKLLTMPAVVLVNKGSASASEILAGALQDYKIAKVVGEQSFGKGSVQQPEDFPDGSGIHVTIAKWLRPSNDWIDKKGITPDVQIKPDENNTDDTKDIQLDKALELF